MAVRLRPWEGWLTDPGGGDHIVQLYQDDEFYASAICRFAASGLAKGESIIVVATEPHWRLISERLAAQAVDVSEACRRGQLTPIDADLTLTKFIVGNMPDAPAFKDIARTAIRKARADGRYPRVRWWGEMVNVLYVDGNRRASTRLEELFTEVGHEESVALFCSFYMDKFDRDIYDGPIGDLRRTHTHLIPAADDLLHRECVDHAVAQVLGEIEGRHLASLIAFKNRSVPVMPASQSVLTWIREGHPELFDRVLAAASEHEKGRLSEGRRP